MYVIECLCVNVSVLAQMIRELLCPLGVCPGGRHCALGTPGPPEPVEFLPVGFILGRTEAGGGRARPRSMNATTVSHTVPLPRTYVSHGKEPTGPVFTGWAARIQKRSICASKVAPTPACNCAGGRPLPVSRGAQWLRAMGGAQPAANCTSVFWCEP